MKKSNVRIIAISILIGVLLLIGIQYNETRKSPPLDVLGYGFQVNGEFFMMLRNYGDKDVRLSSISLNGETIEMELCQSHSDGVPEPEYFVCADMKNKKVPPIPSQEDLMKLYKEGNTEIKPFYTLWYRKEAPAKGDKIELRYSYGLFPFTHKIDVD